MEYFHFAYDKLQAPKYHSQWTKAQFIWFQWKISVKVDSMRIKVCIVHMNIEYRCGSRVPIGWKTLREPEFEKPPGRFAAISKLTLKIKPPVDCGNDLLEVRDFFWTKFVNLEINSLPNFEYSTTPAPGTFNLNLLNVCLWIYSVESCDVTNYDKKWWIKELELFE